ncbi:MAG: glycosyltransferase family 2 protein [Acidobacteriota bacterium]
MPAKGNSRLTVIIPTWNRKDLLRRCLGSLQQQTVAAQILVVDNGSTDSTREMIQNEFKEVDYLRLEKNEGFAKAVNRGIDHSNSEFLALLNNDTEAHPKWVESGLEALEGHPEYGFFASRMIHYLRRDRLDSAGDCYNRAGMPYKRGLGEPIHRFATSEPVQAASAGAAFYRRELFEGVGLFDEDFYLYLEDVEFSLRAQLAGHHCLYLPEAMVYHIEAASDPERRRAGWHDLAVQPSDEGLTASRVYYSSSRVFWITRNRWLLMLLYQPFRHAPWLACGWFKSAAFHLIKVGYFGAFLRGLLAGFARTPSALKKRLARRPTRRISIRQLCQLLRKC